MENKGTVSNPDRKARVKPRANVIQHHRTSGIHQMTARFVGFHDPQLDLHLCNSIIFYRKGRDPKDWKLQPQRP